MMNSSHIEVPAVKYKELRTPALAEDSEAVRSRVVAARNLQLERYRGEQKTYSNAQMSPKMLRKHCAITADGKNYWKMPSPGWDFPRVPTTAS